jgi:hypothetical protein
MNNYEVQKNGQYLVFFRDAGECYGGLRKTTIDTEGLVGKKLYQHVKKHVGSNAAKAAKAQGYCA